MLDSEVQVVRRAEAMEMIGHQEIITDQPRRGLAPCLAEETVNLWIASHGWRSSVVTVSNAQFGRPSCT